MSAKYNEGDFINFKTINDISIIPPEFIYHATKI